MSAQVAPGPRGRLIRGHLPDFTRDRLGFLTRLARDYGDVAAFRLGPRRCLLVSHPEGIEYVLAGGSRHFTKHFVLRRNRLLLGNGLLTSEGDFWRRQRRLAQPAFLRDRVASYAGVMTGCAARLTEGWREGQALDLHAEMTRLTLEIVGQALFGADVGDQARLVADALAVSLDGYLTRLRTLFLVPLWVPTPTHRRLERARRQLDDILFGLINRRRRDGRDANDLLSLLLRARDEDGSRMTDRQLRDEAMTLFLAGHETTALALTWAWYLLARHPAAEQRLAAELHAVLGDRPPTAADLPRLVYTERVVREAMRLYPPVYAVGREAVRACEVGGCRVDRGTTLLMSQWVVHRDPRFFPDPETFDPDRWTEDRAARLPRYAYFPFGGGPRVCIGNAFAVLEMVLVLAALARRFRFALLPDHPVRPVASFTLRPEQGIRVVLSRRAESGG